MGIPPTLTPRRLLNIARHPRWAYYVVRHRRIGWRNLVEGGSVTDALASIEIQERHLMQSSLNWGRPCVDTRPMKGAALSQGCAPPAGRRPRGRARSRRRRRVQSRRLAATDGLVNARHRRLHVIPTPPTGGAERG